VSRCSLQRPGRLERMPTRMTRSRVLATGVIWLSLVATSTVAQDLDPRAYAKAPIGRTLAIAGVSFSSGGVLTDPTLAVENVHADVVTPSVGVAESFSLFGRTAQGLAALPYSWAHVTGEVGEQARRIDRSGLSDMRLRLAVLIAGAPAMTPQQFAKSPPTHRRHEPDGGCTDRSILSPAFHQPRYQSVVLQTRGGPLISGAGTVARRCERRTVAARHQRVVLPRHGCSHADPDWRAADARQLFTFVESLGGLRCHVVWRRASVSGPRPHWASRVEFASRRDIGLSGRQPARDQSRLEHWRGHPVGG
jgi:hypothetical protein